MVNTENIIIKTALQTLEIEANTVWALKKSIDAAFEACLQDIYASQGRLVVTGIGKSALIAQKMVATFNSTGTPALFMHAADAIHGDLGMIRPEDFVLCLSKSGETPEIKVLVPLIKTLGSRLIGMVSNRDSYLGKQADYVIHTPVPQEADPNNLAPTASTTAQAAMGDAMATALLAMRGFSSEDFARFHPGGSLGKQLYLRASDLYAHNEKPAVGPEENLRSIILEMTSKCLGATAVVDDHDHLLGIITDGDLRRMLEKNTDLSHITANQLMTRNPKTIDHQEMAVRGLNILQEYSITQLIVLKDNRYVGMIHLHNMIKEGLV